MNVQYKLKADGRQPIATLAIQTVNTNNMRKIFYLSAILLSILVAGTGWVMVKPVFKNGIWRTVLQRPDGQQIVFNFELTDRAGKKVLYVLNAGERLLVDSVTVAGDSVSFEMPFFESGFRGKLTSDGNLQGLWVKKLADKDQVMPFWAVYNQKQRFPASIAPRFKVSGRWKVEFVGRNNQVTPSVGEFEQNGSRLNGTFLTSTGDYRYLEGVVSGDSLKLSGFDGGHAFLFTARIENDSTISGGRFYSGLAGNEKWTAKKDDKAALPDGYDETKLRPGETSLNFSFKSIDGKTVSIKDQRFKNKVVVVQIMGSWCPNCMDETKFLSEYYNTNRQKGFEVVALAYERTTDFDRSVKSLDLFKKRFNVQYPVLFTGVTVSDTLRTQKTLPQIDEIKGFPTSIFIDKKGNVRKIYTGFTGPGTGHYYEDFKKEFDETIRGMLAE
jgi:thiol-disulfide isomerase/thioredoxin